MLPQILPKDKVAEFVGFLLADNQVVAPMAKGQDFAFQEVATPEDVERIRMDYTVTILPPKKYLLPTYEKLLEFSGRAPSGVTPTIAAEPTVIFGVHPYDMHGLQTVDAALTQEPADAAYMARREVTHVIGLNIKDGYADEHQFMADMGTLEPPAEGWDLFMTDLGDRYYVEAGSDAGQDMVKHSGAFTPATPEDHKARQEFDVEKAANYAKRLPYNTRYMPDLLDASYDSLLWDAVSRRCFSCGSCTNVCPTCYCFDVQDKLSLDATSGTRERMWDSCQLKGFAEVAGGENFREHRASRLRHRMFRKGKYILERTGRLGCVGCGRCIHHCVAAISILEAFQQIADQAEVNA